MRFLRASVAAIGLSLINLTAIAQAPADEGWPAGERVIGKYKAGKYAEVIAEGPAALESEPWNAELRLALANALLWSGQEWPAIEHYRLLLDGDFAAEARLNMANGLAWSGRMAEAVPHYQMLLAGPKADEAKLGLAHAWRWMGRPDLSLPLYQQLRAAYPNQDIGEEGLLFASRELRAKTTAGFGYLHDNTPTTRREPMVSHTFRARDNTLIFGIEGSGGEDWNDATRLSRREYGLRFEAAGWWLAPRLAASRETEPRGPTFGEARLEVATWPLHANFGRVNWGKLSFTVPALDLGLSADRYGVEGKYQLGAGEGRGFANHFSISDGNRIENGDMRLTSRWRPWGRELKPFAGVAWRFSDHTDPAYWSPRRYGLGYVRLEGEWASRNWSINATAQVGVKLLGEASTSWAGSLIAKRWIADAWAIGINAFAQSGTRESKYRADGVTLFVDKLW